MQLAFGIIVSPNSLAYNLIVNLFSVAVNIIFGALFLPFWQSIAGVLYYDLRVRREGQGLKTKRIKDRKSGV